MDSTYMEIGTEVIICRGRVRFKERFVGSRGKIVEVSQLEGPPKCAIRSDTLAPEYSFWWFPDELILASDEPLLRK